jgi:dethiobiotin synthetase
MRGCFVTGTDTHVGKTRVAAGLLRAYARRGIRAVGMKPVASGAHPTADGLGNEDALLLQSVAGMPRPYSLVNPYVFAPAIAPHIAAAEVGVEISLETITAAYAGLVRGAEAVVVEGAGGWQVPLSATLALPDLVRALGLPVVLVVGLRLGCISHALLSARAIRADGLSLAGWVANAVDAGFERSAANIESLEKVLTVPLLGQLPHAQTMALDAVADALGGALERI